MSAAYTFLSANPDHVRMKDNVNFYSSLPEAMPSYFVNLEAKPYQVTWSFMHTLWMLSYFFKLQRFSLHQLDLEMVVCVCENKWLIFLWLMRNTINSHWLVLQWECQLMYTSCNWYKIINTLRHIEHCNDYILTDGAVSVFLTAAKFNLTKMQRC